MFNMKRNNIWGPFLSQGFIDGDNWIRNMPSRLQRATNMVPQNVWNHPITVYFFNSTTIVPKWEDDICTFVASIVSRYRKSLEAVNWPLPNCFPVLFCHLFALSVSPTESLLEFSETFINSFVSSFYRPQFVYDITIKSRINTPEECNL